MNDMTTDERDETFARALQKCTSEDLEMNHVRADELLLVLLSLLGYIKTVAAFRDVDKWYA